MRKRWAPIAAVVLLAVMFVVCVFTIALSKREVSFYHTRSMYINDKNMEITAYALRSQMTPEDLTGCVDGAFSLCQECVAKYFDKESVDSEFGRIADLQRKGEGDHFDLSPAPLLLVRSGLALTELSGGAYDITAGALYRLFSDPYNEPTEDEIAEALKMCGTAGLQIGETGIRLADGVFLAPESLTDCYLCRILEEYFIFCGISNVFIRYGDIAFGIGGKLTTEGSLFWTHVETEPFEVILPDAYTDLKSDRIEFYDGYVAWAARPEAVAANALFVDSKPFVSSATGRPYEHDTGSVAVVVKNGPHAWYAHALSNMFLALGKENAMKLLSSGLPESTLDLQIRYVRFESTSGETEIYDITQEETEGTTLGE